MIKELPNSEWPLLHAFVACDTTRNYFICLGLESKRPVYSRIFVEVEAETEAENKFKAALFVRASGNLQFYAPSAHDFDVPGFSELLHQLPFKEFIAPSSLGDVLMENGAFTTFKDGAVLAHLSASEKALTLLTHDPHETPFQLNPLQTKDLPDVVGLYLKVFKSFSPLPLMEEKLRIARGRGLTLRDSGYLVSVAQSEFETAHHAVVVGVATEPHYQGQGLGTYCMKVLCSQLLLEGKSLSLQYDNPSAGRIYKKLGFQPIDRMRHYFK